MKNFCKYHNHEFYNTNITTCMYKHVYIDIQPSSAIRRWSKLHHKVVFYSIATMYAMTQILHRKEAFFLTFFLAAGGTATRPRATTLFVLEVRAVLPLSRWFMVRGRAPDPDVPLLSRKEVLSILQSTDPLLMVDGEKFDGGVLVGKLKLGGCVRPVRFDARLDVRLEVRLLVIPDTLVVMWLVRLLLCLLEW